ncbi:hypothetical protein [Dictyobacter kobayashii]|uniref:Uncharacterized protein n=1 Tax=Dictyobacter kobayashii TaxID=2014872 RepID=A0A402AHT5_9CHLR|nr:hypothetical protein [Dictyobacter kobayashii]GCE18666.1 hypothetical protein KDK_24660 [Dictyobacter kobayashii]
MFNGHWARKRSQEREHQRVEHCNLIYTVPVTCSGRNTYAFINGERHKVYPTGNDKEPWTTNISLMM